MSAIPPSNELPKCTRTSVIDHIFIRKYALTITETIVVSYLMMLKNWATSIDGYFLLTATKIEDDLHLGKKTTEACFTKLKKLGLIETKLSKVDDWYSNANFKTVRITELGREYNLTHYKPAEHQIILELKTENEDFRVSNSELEQTNMDLEFKNKTLMMQMVILGKL